MLPQVLFTLAVAAAQASGGGEVKLPLRDYLALVEKAEAVQRDRAAAIAHTEAAVAELVSQHSAFVFGDGGADVTTVYEAELRGRSPQPVFLPLSGVAWKVAVEPPGVASVQKAEGGLQLVSPIAGHYRITVRGRVALQVQGGVERVALTPMTAPVAEAEISLPAGNLWSCPGGVIVDDATREGRRIVRLALPRGQAVSFETRRAVKTAEAEKAIASAVVVTLVSLGVDGLRRQDVVLYEVSRGELGTLALTLPAGLEPIRAATDEGEVPPSLDGRELRVERLKRLTATGYLALTSEPAEAPMLPLTNVVPNVKVRANYLVLASSVAADVKPQPEEIWTGVDLSDLPPTVHDVLGDIGFVAAWRLRREEPSASLAIARIRAPGMLETEVGLRESMTLLTVDGTLVHRDRFMLSKAGSALDLRLPPGSTIWSAEVAGVAVRPIEREGAIRIPLGLGSRAGVTAEIVVVEPRKIPPGRSQLDLSLPEVEAPVLEHDWRILLPEGNRYRLAGGDLRRARPGPPTPPVASSVPSRPSDKRSVALGPGGASGIRGRVVDSSGAALPGASVRLGSNVLLRALQVVADGEGNFWFAGLPSGSYSLDAELAGFSTRHYADIQVGPGRTSAFAIPLDVGTVAETITVAAAPPALGSGTRHQEREEAQRNDDFKQQALELRQGLVGGVKPVPVTIPEQGKVLLLAGALPPAHVALSLEVKAQKR